MAKVTVQKARDRAIREAQLSARAIMSYAPPEFVERPELPHGGRLTRSTMTEEQRDEARRRLSLVGLIDTLPKAQKARVRRLLDLPPNE
jgi:hypothetical protein